MNLTIHRQTQPSYTFILRRSPQDGGGIVQEHHRVLCVGLRSGDMSYLANATPLLNPTYKANHTPHQPTHIHSPVGEFKGSIQLVVSKPFYKFFRRHAHPIADVDVRRIT